MSEDSTDIRKDIAEMSRSELELFAYMMSREQDRLHDLLRIIPACPHHGELCMSHAVDWVKSHLANEVPIDCRSETGVTVGLADALITIGRVLAVRDLSAPEIQEALKDLRQDEDLGKVLNG